MNPVSGTTYLLSFSKDLRRRSSFKAAVRPVGIIELSVLFYQLLCLRSILKEISVKAFISELSVETFEVAVLPRTGLCSKFMAYAVLLQKLLEGFASEFGTLIASDDFGCAVDSDASFQNFHSPFSRDTEVAVNAQRKSAKNVLDSHEFDPSAIREVIKKEIYSPNMVRIPRFGLRRRRYSRFFILARPVSLQVEAPIDSVEPLMIDADTPLMKNIENSPIAVKGVFESDLLNNPCQLAVPLRLQRVVVQGTDWDAEKFSCSFDFYSSLDHLFSYYSPFVRCQEFFLTMSFRTCISSFFSARILLSLRFSSSRTLSLFASLDESPLNFCFHFSNVLRLMEYLRQTSATELPGRFASVSICIIFTTGYFVGFISYTPFLLYMSTYVVPKNGVQGRISG